MKFNNTFKGHTLAILTILIWGTTYIATKSLTTDFSPIEILLIRCIVAYIVLWIMYPHPSKPTTFKRELMFFLGGLTGLGGYQYLENIALTETPATTMALIISTAPIFTAIFAGILLKDEKIHLGTILGFIFCLIGIYFINCGGTWTLSFSLKTSILPIICAIFWGMYDVIVRFIHKEEPNGFISTRRIFFYGTLITVVLAFFDKNVSFTNWARFTKLSNIWWLFFLAVLASGIAFYTWNTSEKYLGAIQTSLYLDFQPVITMIVAYLVLQEQLTIWNIIGFIGCLAGLLCANFIKPKQVKS